MSSREDRGRYRGRRRAPSPPYTRYAVVVTGAPPAFCAGADLSHLGQAGQGSEGGGLRSVYEGFLRVQRSPLR